MERTTSKWIPYKTIRIEPVVRIFCFPHAGGSASYFYRWMDYFPDWIDICPIQLPMRENRSSEEALESIHSCIERLTDDISSYVEIPFAIFGHSMGGLLGLEWAHYLQRKYNISATMLFISGTVPPHIFEKQKKISGLSDFLFLQEIIKYGGFPDEILEYQDIKSYVLPILRHDFSLIENSNFSSRIKLSIPLSIYGGDNDAFVSLKDLDQWKEYSDDYIEVNQFTGGHFYLNEHYRQVITEMVNKLEDWRCDNGYSTIVRGRTNEECRMGK
ncbi:thioesterase II family protein [Bacillus cytotoxicus]